MTQREEFERKINQIDELLGVSRDFIYYEDTDTYQCARTNSAYMCWQAAKAQAVPDVNATISNPMPRDYMLNTLIKFQKWRIGEDERTLNETGLTPRSITLAIDWAIEQLDKSKAQAVPEGWKLVPVEPTGEQWGGIARDIIFWLRSDSHQTPESLIEFLRNMGNEIPSWLTDEPEMKNANHVISKGTLAAIIYKAMLSAVPERPE